MNRAFNVFLLGLFLCLGIVIMTGAQDDKPVTDICLGCICEAISGCNQTKACVSGTCGLFRITYPYWVDGGKLTLGDESPQSEQAYPNCANDPFCAAATIQGYMKKLGQDCDGDGNVDCFDYAAIHKLGGYGCQGDLPYQYQNTLKTCLDQFTNIDVRSSV